MLEAAQDDPVFFHLFSPGICLCRWKISCFFHADFPFPVGSFLFHDTISCGKKIPLSVKVSGIFWKLYSLLIPRIYTICYSLCAPLTAFEVFHNRTVETVEKVFLPHFQLTFHTFHRLFHVLIHTFHTVFHISTLCNIPLCGSLSHNFLYMPV